MSIEENIGTPFYFQNNLITQHESRLNRYSKRRRFVHNSLDFVDQF